MSKGTRNSAEASALRSFQRTPKLPLDQDTVAHARALEGRERLTGAFLIEVERIRPDPGQPRKAFDLNAHAELAASIEKQGILQPITVQYLDAENVYQIITGERRFQAAKSLGMSAIPCWVRTPKAEEVLIHQIVENWQRADLHPFDLADTLAQLRDGQGFTQKQIADLTGKPASEISKLLSLLSLRQSIQQQYRRDKSGRLSRRHLENIAKLPAEEQVAFHARVEEQNLTATQTEKLVQKAVREKTSGPARGAPKWSRNRIATPKGTAILLVRKQDASVTDFLDLLDAARATLQSGSA